MGSNRVKNSCIYLGIVLLGFIMNYEYLEQNLGHIHNWAQHAHFGLAQGYIDNGYNFFEPQSFTYNHQFPHNFNKESSQPITAAGFPIVSYLAAFLLDLFSASYGPYQLFTLLLSAIGGLYIYLFAKLKVKNEFKAILISLFFISTPLFVYYQFSLLTSLPAFSLFIMGLYYIEYSYQVKVNKYLYLAILLLTLASLIRMTFLVFFLVIIARDFLFQKQHKGKLLSYILAGLLFISLYLYNYFLTLKYGSIFLNKTLPANSLSEYFEIIVQSFNNWRLSYFTEVHYLVFGLLIAMAFLFYILGKSKIRWKKVFTLSSLIAGTVVFTYFFAYQLPSHDYYFIDICFVPLLFILVYLMESIKISKHLLIRVSLILLFFVPTIYLSFKVNAERHKIPTDSISEITIQSFSNTEKKLEKLGIDSSEKVTVYGAFSTIIPFVLMNRRGFVVPSPSKENILNSLQWDFKYAIVQKSNFFESIHRNYSAFINEFKRIGTTKDLLILKKEISNGDLRSFLRLDEEKKLTYSFGSSENAKSIVFEDREKLERVAGKIIYNFKAKEPYGFTFRISSEVNELASGLLRIKGKLDHSEPVNCYLKILALDSTERLVQSKTVKLSQLTKANESANFKLYTFLPCQLEYSASNTYKVYLHKPDSKKIAISELEIAIY